MPDRLPARRRLATATRWPVGVGLTFWRYLWRTVPMHRLEEEGDWATDAPPPLPDGVAHDEVQAPQDGSGAPRSRASSTSSQIPSNIR